MRVLLICNPASAGGRALKRLPVAMRRLRAAGAAVLARVTEHVGQARELAATASSDIERVVACGGDGLVSEVASGLRGGDRPMAIVPAGRGNDTARALGIPPSVPLAARLAVTGRVERIDLGLANGRPFCTVAACGLDAEVSSRARSSRLPLRGPAVYAVELVRALARFHGFGARLEHDGGTWEGRLALLAVANTPSYGGGFRVAPDADLRDGLLDAWLVRSISRRRVLRLLPAVYAGRHRDLPEVETFRCRELRLTAEPSMTIEADGEPLAATPATYRSEPGALPVVVA